MSLLGALDQVVVQLSRCTCARCSIVFATPADFEKRRRDDHATFYCPSGHANYYPGKSEEELLKALLDAEQARAARLVASLNSEREVLSATRKERDHHWTERKKTSTRLRNLKVRVKHGVCPCCHRTFKQLVQHMAKQHPGYAKEPAES